MKKIIVCIVCMIIICSTVYAEENSAKDIMNDIKSLFDYDIIKTEYVTREVELTAIMKTLGLNESEILTYKTSADKEKKLSKVSPKLRGYLYGAMKENIVFGDGNGEIYHNENATVEQTIAFLVRGQNRDIKKQYTDTKDLFARAEDMKLLLKTDTFYNSPDKLINFNEFCTLLDRYIENYDKKYVYKNCDMFDVGFYVYPNMSMDNLGIYNEDYAFYMCGNNSVSSYVYKKTDDVAPQSIVSDMKKWLEYYYNINGLSIGELKEGSINDIQYTGLNAESWYLDDKGEKKYKSRYTYISFEQNGVICLFVFRSEMDNKDDDFIELVLNSFVLKNIDYDNISEYAYFDKLLDIQEVSVNNRKIKMTSRWGFEPVINTQNSSYVDWYWIYSKTNYINNINPLQGYCVINTAEQEVSEKTIISNETALPQNFEYPGNPITDYRFINYIIGFNNERYNFFVSYNQLSYKSQQYAEILQIMESIE